MKIINIFCTILGGISAFIIGGSFLYGASVAAMGHVPELPSIMFTGICGALSAAFIFVGAHIIRFAVTGKELF